MISFHSPSRRAIPLRALFVLTFAFTAFGYAYSNLSRDLYHFAVYSVADLSFMDNARRVTLVRQAVEKPNSIYEMEVADLDLLFRHADVVRKEGQVVARHYQSGTCVIDVYFSGKKHKPDYVEFRPLSLNADVQRAYADDSTHIPCVKDVLEARGISTPENYAAQPVPTKSSPYSAS